MGMYDYRKYPERQAAYNAEKCKTCPQKSEKCIEIEKWEKANHCRTNHSKRDSLCWCCEYSVPKPEHDYICPWAEHSKPVDGWVAKMHKTAAGELHAAVIDCPNFVRHAEWEDVYGPCSNT